MTDHEIHVSLPTIIHVPTAQSSSSKLKRKISVAVNYCQSLDRLIIFEFMVYYIRLFYAVCESSTFLLGISIIILNTVKGLYSKKIIR